MSRKDSIPRSERERARITESDSLKRLARKAEKEPEFGREILKKGRIVSNATDIATRTALGVGVAVGCGWSSVNCFWDPYDNGQCGPLWNSWCSPGWAWWWTSCACPWWGYGWGFGYWSDSCGFWYGGWPGYCASYPVPYYAPYPSYYSSVIYDSYEPPLAETVYVSQPDDSYPAQPVAEGEGAIHVAGSPAARPRGSTQSTASHFLTLGDQAFREGRFSDAVHYYAKAVDLEPDQGVLHLILSDALFATGDYHYAAYALRRALELDPTLVDSIVDKHTFYSEATEFDRQLELLERYLGDHFLDDDARLLLGANYLFGGRPAQATDLLQSPFSVAIRESSAGKLLLDRALRLREAADGR